MQGSRFEPQKLYFSTKKILEYLIFVILHQSFNMLFLLSTCLINQINFWEVEDNEALVKMRGV